MPSPCKPRHRAAAGRRLPRAGVVAAAATVAVVLLLGGQGSFAFWKADATVNAGSLRTGSFVLGVPTCTWLLTQTGGTATGAPSPDPTTYAGQLLQPGDVVTGSCTAALTVEADHFSGHIEATVAQPPGSPLVVSAGPTISIPGEAGARFTQRDTSVTVTVTLEVPTSDTSDPAADAPDVWNADALRISAVQDAS